MLPGIRNICSDSVAGFSRPIRCGKRLQRLKLRVVRVVTVDAEQILFVAVPVAGPFAVNAYFPVTELVAMTLSAQSVRLGKINQIAGYQS